MMNSNYYNDEYVKRIVEERFSVHNTPHSYQDCTEYGILRRDSLAELMFDTSIPYEERYALFEESVEQQFDAEEGKLFWLFFETFWDLYTIIAEPEFYYLDLDKDNLKRILKSYRSKTMIVREVFRAMEKFEEILELHPLHDEED